MDAGAVTSACNPWVEIVTREELNPEPRGLGHIFLRVFRPAFVISLGLALHGRPAAGIFGMAAYNVSRRMKELGIRVALGARAKHVVSAAVGRPIMLLGVGSLLRPLFGVFANRLLGQIVYQANPQNPVVLVGAVLTGAAGNGSGRPSGPASACRRSIQTHARRVRHRCQD